jgi:hypothetical protein
MKDIIRKILKEENLKQNLKQQMKDYGWRSAAELVGGAKNFMSIMYDNNPMNFLNTFNDLDIVQSKEKPDWTLYRYEKGKNLIVYDKKFDLVYIKWGDIWSLLDHGFGLNYDEVQELTKEWLGKVYNLKGVTPIPQNSIEGL